MKKALLFLLLAPFFAAPAMEAQVFDNLTATQADSLITANDSNPDFVILDVRTPGEYNPEHLEAAINRDYYDSDFDQQLDLLPKHKKYLIHCRSGSRSNKAMDVMSVLGFEEVYNMLGGINAWKSNALPVTATFVPRLMMVSDSIFELKEVSLGSIDTIVLTVTNRANALLIFDEICALGNPEFTTDFDAETTLPGAFDYTFSVFYEPIDENTDSLSFCILSDAGNVEAQIIRRGIDDTSSLLSVKQEKKYSIYPNPVSDFLHISSLGDNEVEVTVLDIFGQKVLESQHTSKQVLELSSLHKGHYILSLRSNGSIEHHAFIKN